MIYMMMMMSLMAFTISSSLMMISMLMSTKMMMDREKSSPFECGFNPKNSARMPFSLQFFMITLLFLIFDVEITLILPFILTINYNNMMNMSMVMIIFLLILVIGLIHEWNEGILNWKM
uniref:NADH-ubiquinone oxidoreductase chain 3 n=1 Tax=Mastinocerus sp. MAS01 TaxID=1205632 RepID=A0A0S2MP34_9COLE|nr:NADH deshydrogenase subunit 3 [Mastinocerus sp. MAS01]